MHTLAHVRTRRLTADETTADETTATAEWWLVARSPLCGVHKDGDDARPEKRACEHHQSVEVLLDRVQGGRRDLLRAGERTGAREVSAEDGGAWAMHGDMPRGHGDGNGY